MPLSSPTTTEVFFSDFLTGSNKAILSQIKNYRKVAEIYERTQYALGRKVAYKATNGTTDKVKVNLYAIKSTNQI